MSAPNELATAIQHLKSAADIFSQRPEQATQALAASAYHLAAVAQSGEGAEDAALETLCVLGPVMERCLKRLQSKPS